MKSEQKTSENEVEILKNRILLLEKEVLELKKKTKYSEYFRPYYTEPQINMKNVT